MDLIEVHRLYGVLWGIKDLLHCSWLVAIHLNLTRNTQYKHLITQKLSPVTYFFLSLNKIFILRFRTEAQATVPPAALYKVLPQKAERREWMWLPD